MSLNTLGATDASILGLEDINASTAAAGVIVDLNGQAESFMIIGSDHNDNFTGGSGDDTINAGAGDDILVGGAGDDTLRGQDGNDDIDAGDGDDVVFGAAGEDVINGGAGDDTISGNTNDDIITGGAGVDIIDGGGDNDTINLANGDFEVGESIDGNVGTDGLVLTDATTVDFTTGTLAGLETLTGSAGDDDVIYSIEQALDFDDIDLGGGVDNTRVNIFGTLDVTGLGTPAVNLATTENGFLTGSTGDDDLTITGAQLDALIFGGGIIDFGSGDDVLNLTSTSTNLNSLGATDTLIEGLETIDASTIAAGITLNLNGQTEDFIICLLYTSDAADE